MDILKILSRGTKLPKKTDDTKLPSAGVAVHPQLFHDPIASTTKSKSKKRKRKSRDVDGEDGAPQEVADEDLSDLDFFAAPKKADHSKINGTAATEKKPPPKPIPKAKLLDEDECRAVLRSHRLKLTVLPQSQPAEPEKSKSKDGKKKKKRKEAETEAAHNKKQQQLYPQPLTAFSQLRHQYEISPRLAENLEKLHYRVPTEVQMASLPLLLSPEVALRHDSAGEGADEEPTASSGIGASGVDLLAVAPTGSGKTLAFLVPAINGVLKRRRELDEEGETEKQQPHELSAVVVAPTRELAAQIADEGKKLAAGTGVRIVLMRKGMRVMATNSSDTGDAEDDDFASENEDGDEIYEDEESGDDEAAAKPRKKKPIDYSSIPVTKADILVTTPMLLLNFLSAGKQTLPSVRSLVLDEADVLLDPLFKDQTLGIWSACTSPHLRISFWSATMASNIETLITAHLTTHNPNNPPTPLIRLVVGLKDTAVPNITHKLIYTATEQGKLLGLRQLLHPSSTPETPTSTPLRPPFIIFTQTISRATALRSELHYDIPLPAGGGASRVAALHSSLPPSQRADIVRRFRAGEVWVLVTTDVAARGLDFRGVNGVVNYDVPASSSAYVHRAGRTCRAGREGGVVVTFYTKDDIPFVRSVANVIRASEAQQGVKGEGVQQWLMDALPSVSKENRKKMRKAGGIEERRDGGGAKARITSRSGFDKRRENNRRGAIEASRRRKREGGGADGERSDGSEWGGFD